MRLLLVASFAIACQKDQGPACSQVVDHILDVTKQGLTGHGNEELGNRKQMIEHCDKTLSKAARTCIAAAKDLEGLAGCRTLEPAAPRDLPRPVPPAAAGNGL